MQSIKNDINHGVACFINKQKELPGKCSVSVYQFSDEVSKVIDFVDIQELDSSKIQIVPTGMTALFDAIKKSFSETGCKLSSMSESERPSRVLVTVVTDGEENSSKIATLAEIRNTIEHQRSKYSWQIDFLGCQESCMNDANKIGIQRGSQMKYTATPDGIFQAFDSLSQAKSLLRSCTMDSYVAAVSDGNVFNETENS
jgi:uncharacterized protein YegL